MTLKEEVLQRRRHNKQRERLNAYMNSQECREKSERYSLFLDVCDRLESNVDLSNVACNTYQEVFDNIEKNNLDISDIIPKDKYDEFKRLMMSNIAQCCPAVGKQPKMTYGFESEEAAIEYLEKHHGSF